MARIRALAGIVAALSILSAAPAHGHGASRGLHIHLDPKEASPGDAIEVALDAVSPIRRARIALVDTEPVEILAEVPARRLEATIVVPDGARRAAINVHVEAVAADGKTLRASAVLRLRSRPAGASQRAGSKTEAE